MNIVIFLQEEFDAEIRRLGALCEARTKELNRVRLELRGTAHALSALAVAFQRWDHKLERYYGNQSFDVDDNALFGCLASF